MLDGKTELSKQFTAKISCTFLKHYFFKKLVESLVKSQGAEPSIERWTRADLKDWILIIIKYELHQLLKDSFFTNTQKYDDIWPKMYNRNDVDFICWISFWVFSS